MVVLSDRDVPEEELMDERSLRNAYARFPTGVVAVCSMVNGKPVGMAASAFMPVSLTPPLIALCFQKSSSTWPTLRSSGTVGISFLGAHHSEQVARLSAKHGERFADVNWRCLGSGAVIVDDSVGWLEGHLSLVSPTGDHDLAIFELTSICLPQENHRDPMIFFASSFHRLRHPHSSLLDAVPASFELAIW